MRDDLERLYDIKESIEKIEKYFDKNKIIRDELLQAAIVRYLEIIGEASRSLKEETKTKSPETEWPKIISFRNFPISNDVFSEIDCSLKSKICLTRSAALNPCVFITVIFFLTLSGRFCCISRISEYPIITLSILLKSCAMPAAS